MSFFVAASPRRKAAAGILIALAAWGLAVGLQSAGLLAPYSLKTLDLFYRLMPLPAASPEVVLITVVQAALDFHKEQGVAWPWPRQLYAPLIQFCQRGGVRAVIFDILYTEASFYGTEDDQHLARAMEASGRVVLPFFLTRDAKEAGAAVEEALASASLPPSGTPPPGLPVYQGVTAPIPPLLKSSAALGNVECSPDPDGIYRRLPLVGLWRGRFLPILSFAAFCRFQDKGEWRFEEGALVRGELRIPVDREGRLLLKFRGPGRSFRRLSAANVIQSEVRLQHGQPPIHHPEELAGKWVLVGLTAPGLFDLKPSPLAPVYPGVELHATLLDNLLKGDFLHEAPFWLGWLWAMILVGGMTLAVLFSSRLWVTLAALGVLSTAHLGMTTLAFWNNRWAEPVTPGLALGFSFAVAAAYSYATEGRPYEERLPVGTEGQVLTVDEADPLRSWPSAVCSPNTCRKRSSVICWSIRNASNWEGNGAGSPCSFRTWSALPACPNISARKKWWAS